MKAFLFWVILSTVICVSVSAFATTLYVDASVSSSGDGTSWATAFKTIQEGIDAADDGDTVTVAQGVYVENIQFKGKNIVLASFNPLNSAVVANTIIDGNHAGSVVTFSGTETEACVLSGFTIRNGSSRLGGGICAAWWWLPTRATIENNTITGNSAYSGGGIYLCAGTIQNNTITVNYGGGLFQCAGTIQNNAITDNYNGGMSVCGGRIRNNTITGNWATHGGGVAACFGTIENNTITGNTAESSGGGLYRCDGTIQNNTITGNSAGEGGGLYACNGTIQNCIIWGNSAPTGPQLYDSSTPMYSCIEGWSGGGQGNIAEDPLFVDPDGPDNDPATYEDNDYRLLAGSPCIDTGKNEDWMWTATDLDGNPRIAGGTVDMGAYEYASWSFKITQVLVETTGGLQLTWTSAPGVAYLIWSCSDLTSGAWTEEWAVPSAGNSTSWTDPSPSGSQKFYRIQQL